MAGGATTAAAGRPAVPAAALAAPIAGSGAVLGHVREIGPGAADQDGDTIEQVDESRHQGAINSRRRSILRLPPVPRSTVGPLEALPGPVVHWRMI